MGFYGKELYSLCYRVSMESIYIPYVTGSLLQGLYSLCYRVSMARIIFSMLQGLYGEDEIVTMGTQIFILDVDLPTETGKLYFCRIIIYRMPFFVFWCVLRWPKEFQWKVKCFFHDKGSYTTQYYPLLHCNTLNYPVLPYTTQYFLVLPNNTPYHAILSYTPLYCHKLPCTAL